MPLPDPLILYNKSHRPHKRTFLDEGREEMGPPCRARAMQLRAPQVLGLGGRRLQEGHPDREGIGGPAFSDSASDCLLPMANLVVHACSKQEEEPSTWGGVPGHRQGLRQPPSRLGPLGGRLPFGSYESSVFGSG